MLHIAVCDDDREVLSRTGELLDEYRSNRLPELHYDTFETAFALLSDIDRGTHFDAVLLDIMMPGMSGMEAAADIRRQDEVVELIFLTSSPEFAVESYAVKARNYVLKPIDREKLFAVMDQIVESVSHRVEQCLLVRGRDGSISRVAHSRLVYCEVIRKEIVYHLADDREIRSLGTMAEVSQQLDCSGTFFQPHRSYLVNMDYVQRVTKTGLLLPDGTAIPLSRLKSAKAMEVFMNYFFHVFVNREVDMR